MKEIAGARSSQEDLRSCSDQQAITGVGGVQQPRRRYSGKLKSITVVSIPADAYPQFAKDKEHMFIDMTDERRIEEIVTICAATLVEQTLCPEKPLGTSKEIEEAA